VHIARARDAETPCGSNSKFRNPPREAANKAVSRFAEGEQRGPPQPSAPLAPPALLILGDAKIPSFAD
jgi:hypothetical protein